MNRSYLARSHRVHADGSIEIEGRWTWVPAIAVAMLLVLPVARRIPMMVLVLLAFGVYMLAFPPRRTVYFDRAARRIRVDHAGLFQERWKLSIRFEDVQAIALERVGRRRFDAIAQTRTGDVYLCTMIDPGDAGRMEERVRALLGG